MNAEKAKNETNQQLFNMKKYLTTLAAMTLAIGGFIIFEGCTKAPELTGDTTGEKQEAVPSEDDLNKAEDAGTGGPGEEEKK